MPWDLVGLVVPAQCRKRLGPSHDKVRWLEPSQRLPCPPQKGKSVA